MASSTTAQIQLIGDLKGFLDLDDKTVMPITFSVSDIRNLTQKSGTFSKSISIPGTKNNNILLGYYYDVNIQAGTFNINRLQRCNVIQNGITILSDALIQLVSVDKVQNNSNYEDKVTYTVLVKDATSDFFSSINNKLLDDTAIDFSHLNVIDGVNTIYNADLVVNSFGNTIYDGFKFVMPFNPSLADDSVFDLTEFSPAFYAKDYWDKIFHSAGYNYNWPTMFNNDIRFDKLVVPYTGDVIKTAGEESELYFVDALRTTSDSYIGRDLAAATPTFPPKLGPFWPTFFDVISIPIEISDPNNNYDFTTSTYTLPNLPTVTNDVTYDLEVDYEINVVNPEAISAHLIGNNALFANGSQPALEPLQVNPFIMFVKNFDFGAPPGSSILNPAEQYPLFGPNDTLSFPASGTTFAPGTTNVKSGTTIMNRTLYGVDGGTNINLFPVNYVSSLAYMNDVYYFYTGTQGLPSGTTMPNVKLEMKIKGIRMKIHTLLNGEYGFGVPMKFNKFRPKEIKQSDFIKSICTMYNLYLEPDRENPTMINIQTRDDYYDSGKNEDWTKKLVKEKSQTLTFLPDLGNKKLLLTYKEDEDFDNKAYQDATREIYGQLEYKFENEYAKGIDKKELIFSPTPMRNTGMNTVCPSWAGGYPNVNVRILHDGGEYYCDDYKIFNFGTDFVSGNTYPHISHWDKPVAPTFDLNFGTCDFYFRTDRFTNTNNNLFNLHWRRTLNQINSGKMLTAYFILNETDIQKLKLNDKIQIDNSYWNINKVIDYDSNANAPTKVELISIDNELSVAYQTRTSKVFSRESPLIGNGIKSISKRLNTFRNTNLSDSDIYINGRNNYIGGNVYNASVEGNSNLLLTSSHIIGDYNNAYTDTIIYGSHNVMLSGITNSFVFGSYITGTTNNTIYTNNIEMSSGSTLNNIPISGLTSQLELVFENGNRGWRLLGDDPNFYGDIGNFAVDFSQSINPTGGATGNVSFATGRDNYASGNYSFVSGRDNIASGVYSHAEGRFTISSGITSHAEGDTTQAFGDASHAEGVGSTASGFATHSEGGQTMASGNYSHAEGFQVTASGQGAHAEGYQTIASDDYTHAEGQQTIASGGTAHSEGKFTVAAGNYSHAEGLETVANANASHSGGVRTKADTYGETVFGLNSSIITGNTTAFNSSDPAFRVGVGSGSTVHADGFRVYKSGALYAQPVLSTDIPNPTTGMFIYDTATNNIKVYNGTAWVTAGNSNSTNMYKATLTWSGANPEYITPNVLQNDLGINIIWSFIGGSGTFNTITAYLPAGYSSTNVIVTTVDDSEWSDTSKSFDVGTGLYVVRFDRSFVASVSGPVGLGIIMEIYP